MVNQLDIIDETEVLEPEVLDESVIEPESIDYDDDMEGIIDMEEESILQKTEEDIDDMEGIIDMEEYSKSKEAEDYSNWDIAKDVGIQGALGFAKSYTWPLDILKAAVIGSSFDTINELSEEMREEGYKLNKNEYMKTLLEYADFVPTQELLEKGITRMTGADLSPKTEYGIAANKFFYLANTMRGQGIPKAIVGGATGAATQAGLNELGAPEIVSDIGGDIIGGVSALRKQPRILSKEAEKITKVAEKHGLPLVELMLKDEIPQGPKITAGRKAAFEKELGMTTETAIQKVVEDSIPLSKLRAEGKNLEVLEKEAYNRAGELAKNYKNPVSSDNIISSIDGEIARIKARAPDPSNGEKAAIRVLEKQKKSLIKKEKAPKVELLDASGRKINADKPQKAKDLTINELINQTQNNNSNVKSVYRKPEFSGVEEEVKNAYGFINDTIRKTIETKVGKDVSDAYKVANKIYSQNASLSRAEGLISKAFQNGEYSAKKLNQVLNSKQGSFLRRDLGKQGVKELQDIATYGTRAQKATTQFANSSKHGFNVSQWGPVAGFLMAKVPPAGAAAALAKPMFDYVRGWVLTNPAARTVYSGILKNAANGSFKNMTGDFAKLEKLIVDDYGSVEDFFKQGIYDVEFYDDDED